MDQKTSHEKVCIKCGINKPSTIEYFKPAGYSLGGTCRECANAIARMYRQSNKNKLAEYNREYREKNREVIKKYNQGYRQKKSKEINTTIKNWKHNNPEKIKAQCKEYYRKNKHAIRARRYKLTPNELSIMFEVQNGVCAICERSSLNKRDLHIDHDHASGAVRGLLCKECNLLLGYARDNTDVLSAAVRYLNNSSFVQDKKP